MSTEHAKRPSATKRGPGRYASHGKAGNRLTKARPTRAYVALMAAWAAKRVTTPKTYDSHGAVTFVGGRDSFGERRVWLAGISAQRGY